MKLFQHLLGAAASCGLLAAPTLGWSDEVADDSGPPRVAIVQAEQEKENTEANDAAQPAEEPSGHWFGIQITELPDLVRAQLQLKQGVVIESVVPDSPADKAGLQADDILLKVGDAAIEGPDDVLDIVGTIDGQKVAVIVLRAGQEKTLEVQPGRRPTDIDVPFRVDRRADNAEALLKKHRAAMEALERALADRKQANMMFVRPGVVGAFKPFELPKDVSITIKRTGQEPAEVTVERGEKSWTAKEGNLKKIPADLRPYVVGMLHGMPMPFTKAHPGGMGPHMKHLQVLPEGLLDEESLNFEPDDRREARKDRDGERLDEAVGAMRKELRELRKQMNELQQRLPAEKE